MQEPRETSEYVDFEGGFTPKSSIRKALESFFFGPYFVVACLFLVGIISFCLGYYAKSSSGSGDVEFSNVVSSGEVKGVSISPDSKNLHQADPSPSMGSTGSPQAPITKTGQASSGQVANPTDAQANPSDAYIVASKNGTKYHYPWCSGAKQISDKNKITFKSIEEARKAGYTPASNCKGLK